METMHFVNDGGSVRFVRFDGMATIKSLAAPIMANAIRSCGGDNEAYRELVQEGMAKVLEVVREHNPKSGPLCTRAAMYLMGIRETNRNESIMEAVFGLPLELDAPSFAGDDDQNEWSTMGTDEPWEAEDGLDLVDPEAEIPDEGRVVMFAGMDIPDEIDERYFMLDAMHPNVFLAMVLDYLFGIGRQLELKAAVEVAEKDLPLPKWDRNNAFHQFAEDGDLTLDDDLAGGREAHEAAWMVGQEDQDFEDTEFLDMAFEVNSGRWLVERDRFALKAGGIQGIRLETAHMKSGHMRQTLEITELPDDKELVFEDKFEALNADLDAMGWHLPTQREMEKVWDEFKKNLTVHEETKLSVAYQYAVVRALTQGYGKEEAINIGKRAHRQSLTMRKVAEAQTKRNDQGEQLEALILKLKGVPSKNSWKKAVEAKKTQPVVIQKRKSFPGFELVAGKVGSSAGGHYQTYVKLGHNEAGMTFIGGFCNCEAGAVGCYHEALLALAAKK
jgi:hypothetical protein